MASHGIEHRDYDEAQKAEKPEDLVNKDNLTKEELNALIAVNETAATKNETQAAALKQMNIETGDKADFDAIKSREIAAQKAEFMKQFPEAVREGTEAADTVNIDRSVESLGRAIEQSPRAREQIERSSLEEIEGQTDTKADQALYAKSGGRAEGVQTEDAIEHSLEQAG